MTWSAWSFCIHLPSPGISGLPPRVLSPKFKWSLTKPWFPKMTLILRVAKPWHWQRLLQMDFYLSCLVRYDYIWETFTTFEIALLIWTALLPFLSHLGFCFALQPRAIFCINIIHTEAFKSEAIPARELPSHVTSLWTTSIRVPGAVGDSVSPHLGQSGCGDSDTIVCSEARRM